ncbi:MAG: hypothetical protein QM752_02395 [Gammaproteobacteria bacterium]
MTTLYQILQKFFPDGLYVDIEADQVRINSTKSTEIDPKIEEIIDQFNKNQTVSLADFQYFEKYLSSLKKFDGIILAAVIKKIILDKYKKIKPYIKKLELEILENTENLESKALRENKEYIFMRDQLLEMSVFSNINSFEGGSYVGGAYTAYTQNHEEFLNCKKIIFPLAINILKFKGIIPESHEHLDVKFDRYFYFESFNGEDGKGKGISQLSSLRERSDFIPFKAHHITRKNNKTPIIMAFDRLKRNNFIYIRCQQGKGQCSLASKVAKFIAPMHFAEEERLNAGFCASSQVKNLYDKETALSELLEDFPNLYYEYGIIVGVLARLNEGDQNPENFLFFYHNDEKDKLHIARIDFEGSALGECSEYLRKNIKSRYFGPYSCFQDISDHEAVKNGQKFADIMFACLPKELLDIFSQQAFFDSEEKDKASAVSYLKKEADRSLSSLNDSQLRKMLKDNKSVELIVDALKDRADFVRHNYGEKVWVPFKQRVLNVLKKIGLKNQSVIIFNATDEKKSTHYGKNPGILGQDSFFYKSLKVTGGAAATSALIAVEYLTAASIAIKLHPKLGYLLKEINPDFAMSLLQKCGNINIGIAAGIGVNAFLLIASIAYCAYQYKRNNLSPISKTKEPEGSIPEDIKYHPLPATATI